jgi:DNA invertase Pin-like site-specific DNA recombinase
LYAARGRLIPFNRAELAKVMKRLERDDLLIVTRLDRLARSTRDLLNILHALAERGARMTSVCVL